MLLQQSLDVCSLSLKGYSCLDIFISLFHFALIMICLLKKTSVNLNCLLYWTVRWLYCNIPIYNQSSRCVPVLWLWKREGGWAVDRQTRGGDRRPADHTCCDICLTHTLSPPWSSTHSPSWVWTPGVNPNTVRNGTAKRGLASFFHGRRRCLLLHPTPPGSTWESTKLALIQ